MVDVPVQGLVHSEHELSHAFFAFFLFSGLGKYNVRTDLKGEPRIIRVHAHELGAVTRDGADEALTSFVVKSARLRAHADESHRIHTREQHSVPKTDCAREVLRQDVVESGCPKDAFERAGLAKTVTAVGDGSGVSLCNSSQLVKHRKFFVRAPGAHAQPAALHQGAMHLPGACRSIRKELKPLLTDDDIESFAVAKRERAGVSFPPIDRARDSPRDGDHLRFQVNADNRPRRVNPLLGESRDNPGSARDIENAVARPDSNILKQGRDPGLEEWGNQDLLIDLGETWLGE